MDFETFFAEKLEGLHKEGRYRVFADLERRAGMFPRALRYSGEAAREVTVWCSNDYLGMGQHPAVIAAMHDALDKCGAGAGGTRNISGTNHYHVLLERELADLHGKERALLFTSGYVSNWTTLSTLGANIPGCVIFSDEGNHASMIEGIRHSKARKRIFRHNDPKDLDRVLSEYGRHVPKIVAFESVYSMDGDIAPIADIVAVAEKHGAMTYLDEVHAVGMYGSARRRRRRARRPDGPHHRHRGHAGQGVRRGRRLHRRLGQAHRLRALLRQRLHLHHRAAAACGGRRLTSIRHLKASQIERARHQDRVRKVRAGLDRIGIPYMRNPSHIVPVMVGDAAKCKWISDLLLDRYGIYVQPINYPTVPRKTERLRITPSPLHTRRRHRPSGRVAVGFVVAMRAGARGSVTLSRLAWLRLS